MNKTILNFLRDQRVAVVAVSLPDGTPHASTVHFSHREEPLAFYIMTDRTYRKCEPLLGGSSARASLVIGMSEEDMKTLQMDGEVELVSDEVEIARLKPPHFEKIPDAKQYEDDPDTVFLRFIPSWWRYSDYTAEPKVVYASSE